MPTYEYICESCGYEFEQFQSIKARPLRKCPRCGRASVRRLIGVGAGVIFKGPGFYATDYRSESYKKAAESEKSAIGKGTDKKETTAESGETKSSKKAKHGTKEKNTQYPAVRRPQADLRDKSA
ncbi:MAG: FmdB family zinc ribbon protein [Phycisphaerae bacterium]